MGLHPLPAGPDPWLMLTAAVLRGHDTTGLKNGLAQGGPIKGDPCTRGLLIIGRSTLSVTWRDTPPRAIRPPRGMAAATRKGTVRPTKLRSLR